MNKLRFKYTDGRVEIYARRLDTGRWALFGTCHPATVPLLKADGIRKHAHLIRLP